MERPAIRYYTKIQRKRPQMPTPFWYTATIRSMLEGL